MEINDIVGKKSVSKDRRNKNNNREDTGKKSSDIGSFVDIQKGISQRNLNQKIPKFQNNSILKPHLPFCIRKLIP